MNINHSKYPLQSIRTTREGGYSDGATNIIKAGRRRRLLARDASNLSNSSMDGGSRGGSGGEYHAQASVAVPFIWESSPGTPKRYIANTKKSSFREVDNNKLLPSLTPPPCYEYHRSSNYATPRIRLSSKKNKQNDSNVNLIQTIFPRLSIKRDHPPSLSPSSSSSKSSSSSSSSSSSPASKSRSMMSTPSPISRHRLSFDSSADIEVEEEEVVMGGGSGSPISTLCFRRFSCCNGKLSGLYSNWF